MLQFDNQIHIYTTSDIEKIYESFLGQDFKIKPPNGAICDCKIAYGLDRLFSFFIFTSLDSHPCPQTYLRNLYPYHKLTHELPAFAISGLKREINQLFLIGAGLSKDKQGDNNPLIKAVASLDNVVIFYDGKAHKDDFVSELS
jgi:hypothetical protein